MSFWRNLAHRLDFPVNRPHLNSWGLRLWIRRAAKVMAVLGNPYPSLLIWIAVSLLVPKVGVWGTTGALAGLALYKLIKLHTLRPRPFETHDHIIAYAVPPDAHSFPSGHTLNATVLAMTLMYAYPILAPVAMIWMVGMGMSRVILGLHYPTDVLVGGVLGIMLGSASIYASIVYPITVTLS